MTPGTPSVVRYPELTDTRYEPLHVVAIAPQAMMRAIPSGIHEARSYAVMVACNTPGGRAKGIVGANMLRKLLDSFPEFVGLLMAFLNYPENGWLNPLPSFLARHHVGKVL